jgi:hypothetical protein
MIESTGESHLESSLIHELAVIDNNRRDLQQVRHMVIQRISASQIGYCTLTHW